MEYPGATLGESTTTTSVAPSEAPAPVTPAPVFAAGRVFGRYELVALIGSGGMADVWLARARAEGRFVRLVALKLLRADAVGDARARERFVREAEIAASIRHVNVVDVFDFGEVDGVLFQAMALVEGDSLSGLTRSRGEPPSLRVVLGVASDALLGLAAAHESVDERGRRRVVVHRDVSPQNILVGRDGVARIGDFGIARVLDDGQEATTTRSGKYAYFAPEQVRREPIDPRTDVFAMGVVLWETLTGSRLFKGADAIETLERVCRLPVPDPTAVRPDLPEPVRRVVMTALEREPGRRYASARAMADALDDAAREAGVSPSRKDVSEWVERAAGKRTTALLTLAAAGGPTSPSVAAPTGPTSDARGASPSAPRRAGPARSGRTAAVAAVALVAGGTLAWALARPASSTPTEAAPTASAPALPVASSAPAVREGAVLAPPPSDDTPTAPPSAHAPPANRRPRSEHAPSSRSPRPPIRDNPFKQP